MLQYRFYKTYIKDTAKEELIVVDRGFLCNIKLAIQAVLDVNNGCKDRRVYLNTKSLKHIYDRHIFDKNNPVDFMRILNNLTQILKYPDRVQRNLDTKRGDFLFVKKIEQRFFFVSLEMTEDSALEVVSSSATGEKYLKKFAVLWSWGDG